MRELEDKCRAQSEQFSLLSRDLEKFRQHAGAIDLLGGSLAPLDAPLAPSSKPFPQFMNGLAPSIGAGERPERPRLSGPSGEGTGDPQVAEHSGAWEGGQPACRDLRAPDRCRQT